MMQRKFLNLTKSKKYLDFSKEIRFWSPVSRDDWIVKFSVRNESEILLIVISQYTGQTIIRYFPNENGAVKYINFITSKDANEFLEGDENPA
jgi:hypothetical protein